LVHLYYTISNEEREGMLMLKQWSGTERPSDEVLAERLQAAREKLARQ